MTKLIYKKTMTRDNSLIIQDVWHKAFLQDTDGNRNPFEPTIIYYLNDGVVEIWENEKAIKWYQKKLLAKNKKDDAYFDQKMKEYEDILEEINKYFKNTYLKSIDELKKFIELLEKATDYFLVFYYSGLEKKTPNIIKKKAITIRDDDTLYDDTNKLIRETLGFLFPDIKSYEIAVTKEELNNIPHIEELKKRKKNCVLIPDKTLRVEDIKKFLEKNPQYKFIFDKIPTTSLIKGQTGFSGKVQGKVKVLKTKDKINTVTKGDIIVSPMTTPEFIPAMQRASAFVTDEGGITCHAAIIAREMKKPCVIGTKVATKVFKDGDMVEVDATKGVVRKINK